LERNSFECIHPPRAERAGNTDQSVCRTRTVIWSVPVSEIYSAHCQSLAIPIGLQSYFVEFRYPVQTRTNYITYTRTTHAHICTRSQNLVGGCHTHRRRGI